jgi:hypothetical protein
MEDWVAAVAVAMYVVERGIAVADWVNVWEHQVNA